MLSGATGRLLWATLLSDIEQVSDFYISWLEFRDLDGDDVPEVVARMVVKEGES